MIHQNWSCNVTLSTRFSWTVAFFSPSSATSATVELGPQILAAHIMIGIRLRWVLNYNDDLSLPRHSAYNCSVKLLQENDRQRANHTSKYKQSKVEKTIVP